MAFQKIDNGIGMPSLASLLGTFQQLQQQELENKKASLANKYTEATQPSTIQRDLLTNNEFMKLLPEQTQLQIIQAQQAARLAPLTTQSQIDVMPSATGATIATNKANQAKQGLEQDYPLFGYAPDIAGVQYLQAMEDKRKGAQQPPVTQIPYRLGSSQPTQDDQAQGGSVPAEYAGQVPGNTFNGLAAMAYDKLFAPTIEQISRKNYYDQQTNAIDYSKLTPEAKMQIEGIANANNIQPSMLVSAMINQGKNPDITSALMSLGVKPESMTLEPKYLPTKPVINQLEVAGGKEAELNYLDNWMANSLAPYATKFNGYSPAQIADSFKTDKASIDKQANFYAARMMTTQMAAIRNGIDGVENGIEAVKLVRDLTYGDMKTLQPTMTPEVFQKTQEILDQKVKGAFEARQKEILGSGSNDQSSQGSSSSQGGGDSIQNNDPLGIR